MTPRKADGAPLALEQIIDAALAIIDEGGLDALSMRKLGARLGVDASSLYYHVASQAALYDRIADRIMSAIHIRPWRPGESPRDALIAAGHAYFDALTAHPRALPLLTARPVRSLELGRAYDALLGILYAGGLTPTDALSAAGSLGWFVLGAAQNFAAQHVEPGYAEDIAPERLAELAQAERANVRRMLEEAAPRDFRDDLDRGLAALARGLLEREARD
ncbi:MAG: TetR family transcriptional regulator [Anaerosomatales bacterium]|nr:TetR family transcriptional regulator [Anaerosomatales bacterium]